MLRRPAARDSEVTMKTIGIVAHSAEGGALCFITACREGATHLGPHMHPDIVLSAVPMGLSMPGWISGDRPVVATNLTRGVEQVAKAGADFFVCPDNTAHIVLEEIVGNLPLPGLHIADVVCLEIERHGWRQVGLLGTRWTMTGPVYARALSKRGMTCLIPDESTREELNAGIFDELVRGVFTQSTTNRFIAAIEDLAVRGAECVILGCTEIPLIITSENSPLPILDSTRLLAKYAVAEAVREEPVDPRSGWLQPILTLLCAGL
jgi:aspartate racemase